MVLEKHVCRILKRRRLIFWKQTTKMQLFLGDGLGEMCRLWGSAHNSVLQGSLQSIPLTSFSSSLRRSERAFFLPIYNIVILFCIFPSSFLFLFSLFLERGQDKARRQIPLIPGALMEFLGLSNHKYFFSYLNVEKV